MPDIAKLSGLTIEDMHARRKECAVEYYGTVVTFAYYVEQLTATFSTDIIRVSKLGERMGKRYRVELERLIDEEPELDEDKARVQDMEAGVVLDRMREEGRAYKRQVAAMLAPVIAEWDITSDGRPYPITAANIAELDDDLLGLIVGKILQGGKPLGKPSGRRSSKR